MRARALVVLLLLLAVPAFSQDPLSEAMDAYRKGDLSQAAKLFSAAANAERDPAKRADIRVKLAVTYFNMKNRSKAEDALAEALSDQPQLELVPDFFADDFLALFRRVKARATAETRSAPTPPPQAARQPAGGSNLGALRQRLAQAVDNSELASILADIQQLEAATPVAGLPDVLELKAETLERLGRTSEALEQRGRLAAMRTAAQALPGQAPVPLEALLQGRQLIAAGKPQEAEGLMRGVLSALPSCVPAFEVLGEALLGEGKLDEATAALRTAMFGNEKPELYLLLGEVELKRGRLPSARDAFRRVIDLDPGNDRALAALGLLAARMEDMTSAKDALDKALQSNGTLFEARAVRAEIALREGQTAAAISNLQRALQVKPDDPWATGWLGFAYLASGDAHAAVDRLQVANKTLDGVFGLALAEGLRRLGKPNDALAILANAKGDDRETRFVRARCLIDVGKLDEAVTTLKELVSQRPDDGRASYLLGYALLQQRSYREAANELLRATTLAGAPPNVKVAADTAGVTLRAQELMDAALTPPALPAKQ